MAKKREIEKAGPKNNQAKKPLETKNKPGNLPPGMKLPPGVKVFSFKF